MVRYSPPEADDTITEALTEIAWRTWYLEPASPVEASLRGAAVYLTVAGPGDPAPVVTDGNLYGVRQ